MYTLVSVLPHFYFPRNTAEGSRYGKPYLTFLFCICIFSCICNGISCFIFSCIFWPFNLLVSFGQLLPTLYSGGNAGMLFSHDFVFSAQASNTTLAPHKSQSKFSGTKFEYPNIWLSPLSVAL